MNETMNFIGRKTELDQIEEAFSTDTRCAIYICGEGGIGKTRLLQEAQQRALLYDQIFGVKQREITVGLVQEFTASEWSEDFIRGVRQAASELNVRLIETDAHFDYAKMAADLAAVVNQKPDAVIISLGSDASLRAEIERAVEQGIKVLTFDNNAEGLDQLTIKVSQDDFEGARLTLEQMAEDLDFEGEIAVVSVPDYLPLRRRRSVLDVILKKYPALSLVAEFGAMGPEAEQQAYLGTLHCLEQFPELRAIWTGFDEFARGVVRGLLEAHRTDVLVYSFDLVRTDLSIITQADSPWRATVAIDPAEGGRAVVRLATLAAYGSSDLKRYYSLPMQLLTQERLRAATLPENWYSTTIGWTRWLKSLSAAIRRAWPNNLLVGPILDFDERSLKDSEVWEQRLAQLAGPDVAKQYAHARYHLRQLQSEEPGSAEIAHREQQLRQNILRAFSDRADERRLILFVDTIEKLSPDAQTALVHFISHIDNSLCLIAGRPENAELWRLIRASYADCATLLELTSFSSGDRREYLQQKLSSMHITLDEDLQSRLLELTNGRPILIDLAAEYVARTVSLNDLVRMSSADLANLAPGQLDQLHKDFETSLVRHIAQVRRPIDQLLLVMSRVYPINTEMTAQLLGISSVAANLLLTEAQSYTFIKSLPGKQGLSLHDEMRRMIEEHVWPYLDPAEDRRQRDSALAADYWYGQVRQLRAQIERADTMVDQAPETDGAFTLQEAQQRELWTLYEQLVFHSLYADCRNGLQSFVEAFDEATQLHRFALRAVLLDLVQPYLPRLMPGQIYEVESRHIRHLIDTREYEYAQALCNSLLIQPLEPSQTLDILLKAADCGRQLGHLTGALRNLEEARGLCNSSPDLQRWLGSVLNLRGLVNRMMGRMRQAKRDYESALDDAVAPIQIASILNNLAFIVGQEGRYRSALDYHRRALAIREDLGLRREIGASHSTAGEIYRNWNKYDDALREYNEALSIFEPEDDQTWMARLYGYRGAVYRLQGDLSAAKVELSRSLALEVRPEMPWVYHVLGCVYWNGGDLIEAVRCLRDSDRLAQQVHDVRSQVNNRVAHAEIAYERLIKEDDPVKRKALKEEIWAQYHQLQRMLGEEFDFPHHMGRMERVVADLLFDEGQYNEARDMYGHAYATLGSRAGGYGRRTFFDELARLAQRIDGLAEKRPDVARDWCNTLEELWSRETIMRQDELLNMLSLRRIQIKLNTSSSGSSNV